MASEKWQDIMARRWAYAPTESGGLVGPPVRTPTCKDHCSSRHEVDSHIVCDTCGKTKYRVVLHEYAWREGHYFTEMVPLNGAARYDPKVPPVCCGVAMKRR